MAEKLQEKLKFLLKKNNLQVKDVTEAGEMNRGYFSDSIGKNKYNQSFIEAIIKVLPDIDLNWFLKNEPVKESLSVATETSKKIEIEVLKKRIFEIFEELEK